MYVCVCISPSSGASSFVLSLSLAVPLAPSTRGSFPCARGRVSRNERNTVESGNLVGKREPNERRRDGPPLPVTFFLFLVLFLFFASSSSSLFPSLSTPPRGGSPSSIGRARPSRSCSLPVPQRFLPAAEGNKGTGTEIGREQRRRKGESFTRSRSSWSFRRGSLLETHVSSFLRERENRVNAGTRYSICQARFCFCCVDNGGCFWCRSERNQITSEVVKM